VPATGRGSYFGLMISTGPTASRASVATSISRSHQQQYNIMAQWANH
jgi:hypothetical protein